MKHSLYSFSIISAMKYHWTIQTVRQKWLLIPWIIATWDRQLYALCHADGFFPHFLTKKRPLAVALLGTILFFSVAWALSCFFFSGSMYFLLRQHTFGCGSIHLVLLQYPLFVVAGQVFWSIWCGRCRFWGYIEAISYPVTISQQRIMLEQTARCSV